MSYIQRIATPADKSAIALLWKAFIEVRSLNDPTLTPTPGFDYERYVENLLSKPLSYCFVLESGGELVGFLFTYIYDEAPPPNLPEGLNILEKPFKPRRVGSVLGLYVQEQHRKLETIKLLVDAALVQAEALKVTDIDVSIGAEQEGIHALLARLGFTKATVQYVKHYEVIETHLPSLHPN
ncbi:GNAT family N-acetyltransferase [Nostoc sp. TCL26-01]|uniref:GNAT family N-acetyltransferase n=1 Tax=Nostoc sp. TCL26-01 TaxID=2576904 RepID=UPI0015BFE62A|nr:GNAT family N-acetyltransferase [Nostoc sp. TCL26-01]